jgi:hypothetical protein
LPVQRFESSLHLLGSSSNDVTSSDSESSGSDSGSDVDGWTDEGLLVNGVPFDDTGNNDESTLPTVLPGLPSEPALDDDAARHSGGELDMLKRVESSALDAEIGSTSKGGVPDSQGVVSGTSKDGSMGRGPLFEEPWEVCVAPAVHLSMLLAASMPAPSVRGWVAKSFVRWAMSKLACMRGRR